MISIDTERTYHKTQRKVQNKKTKQTINGKEIPPPNRSIYDKPSKNIIISGKILSAF